MSNPVHHCRTCDRTPEQTAFRLNGSGMFRADCNECERTKQKMKRQAWRDPQPIDDTPQVAEGYAMMPYQGAVIAWDTDGGMLCLTDLHRAEGSPDNKDPYSWLRLDSTQEYIEECRRQGLIASGDRNSLSRRGAHGGTWHEKIVGLAYAQYLSAALYVACNRFVLDQWGQARQGATSDELLRGLYKIAEHLGVRLPALERKVDSVDRKVDGLGRRLDTIDTIHTSEPEQWVGQVYVIHITDEHQIFLLKRLFKSWPEDFPYLIAVGRTGASGDIHELRLKDYTGKIQFLPEDYISLAYYGTPTPGDCEMHTLQYPLPGCVRLRLKNGKFSLTFLAADRHGIMAYQKIGCGKYYTLQSLELVIPKPIVPPPPQEDFFGSLGL